MTCHVHCVTPRQVLPANTSLINSKYYPCNPKWQAQNIDKTSTACLICPSNSLSKLQAKPSKRKNKLLVLGHIITRNLNKKRRQLPWNKRTLSEYRYLQTQYTFFFPEYTWELCFIALKNKWYRTTSDPCKKYLRWSLAKAVY